MEAAGNGYTLSRKMQIAAIFVVCAFFVLAAIFCLSHEKKAYQYDFNVEKMEHLSGEDGEAFLRTDAFHLPVGNYEIEIVYASKVDGSVLVQGNNDCVYTFDLPSTAGLEEIVTDASLILPCGTDRGKISFFKAEEGDLYIDRISIHSSEHIYTDYYAYLVLAALLAAGLIVLILLYNKLRISNVQGVYVLLLLGVIILVNIPYFTKGLYFEIDTQGHLQRIEAIVQGLRDRQLPVLIGPNYANEYGELVALQPNLFLYFAAALRLMNVSITASYHIYLILLNVATAFVATLCAERMFGSLRWGIVVAMVYLLEPFRLYMMLELGAGAGTGTALLFLPLLVTGMHETMRRDGRKWKYIAFGLWGIACSHVLSFALSCLLLALYILVHIRKMNGKVFFSLVKAALLFLALSVGTLVPFAHFYFQEWNVAALEWSDFYHYPLKVRKELQHLIGLIILSISYIGVRRTGALSKFGRGIFAIGAVNLIISSVYFPWVLFQRIPLLDTFLSMLQYPSRFHFLAVPMVAFAAGEAICSNLDGKTGWGRLIASVIILVLGAGVVMNLSAYYRSGVLFHDSVSGYINTPMEDYLPAGTESEWYSSNAGDFSDYDQVEASSYTKKYTRIDCTYSAKTDGQYMDFPLFYYDGYVATDETGAPLLVENGEYNRVRVYLQQGENHELHLHYEVRKLYTVLFLFSIAVCALSLIYESVRFFFKIKRSKRIFS